MPSPSQFLSFLCETLRGWAQNENRLALLVQLADLQAHIPLKIRVRAARIVALCYVKELATRSAKIQKWQLVVKH